MPCNIMVTSPNDCPPTCTASPLPSPESRLYCQTNSALIVASGRGGQGGFAGKGSVVPTTTNDASLLAADSPALATAGQQDNGGFVVTHTSVQVVTVGSSTGSGRSVTVISSFSITSSAMSKTAISTPSKRLTSTISPSSTTTSMTETTGTAAALTAAKRHKSFMQTTGGWVTIFLVVAVILVCTILGVLFWRRKKMKAKKQGEYGGEADEAALRRDAGDWSTGPSVPLTGVTVAGPEYCGSVAVVRTEASGSQRGLVKAGSRWKKQRLTAAGSSAGKERDVSTNAQPEGQCGPSSGAQFETTPPSAGTIGLRTGQLAPPRERFSIASSIYSVEADLEGTAHLAAAPRTEPASRTVEPSRTQRRSAKDREREWNDNAMSGVPDLEEAADRAANEAREMRLKMQADATQATAEVKDSWDYKKNMTTGPERPKMKPTQGIGPKARREPGVKVRDSGLGMKFQAKEQRELDVEIQDLMNQSHPKRIDGQEYDRNTERGLPARPMKSIRRVGMNAGLVEMEVSEEEMERRRKWMEAGKEERRRQRDATGKVEARQASPIQDNDTIQSERMDWGFAGPVKVGNPRPERVDKGGIGRTSKPIDTNKVIREHRARGKEGAPF